MVREISNKDFVLSENLPTNALKAEQFVTLLDLVSDGAEIEGFATPSRNSIPIPTSMLRPATPQSPEFTSDAERTYISLAQRDIFLDGRAIRTLGGVENIKKTALAIRVGQAGQDLMAGINEFRIAGNLNPAIVKNNRDPEGNAVNGTIDAGTNINNTPRAVIVTLNWASLRQISPDDGSSQELGVNFGAFRGVNPVLIQIRLISNAGNVISNSRFPVNGFSVGPYSADYRIDIPFGYWGSANARSVHYPITVQVVREDLEFRADPAIGKNPHSDSGRNLLEEGQRRFTEFSFAGLQGVIPQVPTLTEFKNTAYIGLRYSAEQFPNIPQRKYLIRGIKVKIPTGVTVDIPNAGRIEYPANYTFTELTTIKHWTSDPVWILYGLLTESYGLGLSEAKIDKASFYAASTYCSGLIAGKPRYSFNGVIKTRKAALDVIKDVCGMMRASLYYRNGSLKIGIDRPETTVSYLFTNANVVDGVFSYSGVDKDKKYSQVNVSYFNNTIQENDQISVREESNFQRFGLNQINVQSLFTTDRDQAVRFGRSIVYSSNFETELVTFDCGIEAACILEPFMVIKIADRSKETIRTSGRIKSVSTSGNTTTIVVDDSTETSLGVAGDSFSIIRKDGSVQESVIQTVNGSTITVSPSISTNSATDPIAGTIFAIKTGNVQHKKYRITNIKQKNNFVFNITALNYDDNKYAYIDNFGSTFFGLGSEPTTLLEGLPAPEIHELKEELVVVNNRAQSNIVLNFAHVDGARVYQVAYEFNGGDPVVTNVSDNHFKIMNNKAGSYKFTLKTIATSFFTSTNGSEKTIEALGLSIPPAAVSNLRSEESGNNLILKFDRATDKDVLFGGKVRIKYALVSDGTAIEQNANILLEVDGNTDQVTINDYQSGEYFVKFIDVAGNESPSVTSVVVNRTITSENLLAAQIRENTNNFQGTKTNVVYDSSISGLRLTSGTTIDSLTDFNTLALADGTTFSNIDDVVSGITSSGNYVFQNDIDLGATFRLHIEPHFKKSGFNTNSLFDSFTDNIDTWPDIFTSSAVVFDKSAELTFQVAKSTTATASTSFETFTNTDIIARTLSFKVLVNNDSGYENVDIEELGVNLFFRPRTERSIDNSSATDGVLTSSGSGATTVNFNKKFFMGTSAVGGSTTKFKPVIGININNMQSGDFFTIDSVSSSNFVVSIKNGSSFVARQFTYNAFGYGEG